MIILGDIASPTEKHSAQLDQIFNEYPLVFSQKAIIGNFEGLIADDWSLSTPTPILFNHSSVINVLKKNNAEVLALANNHTLDIPSQFEQTIKEITDAGMQYVGAYKKERQPCEPIFFTEKNKTIIVFNYCWDFLLYHQKNPSEGVNIDIINEEKIIQQVQEARIKNPSAKIIVYVHWSFDLETLPFPMYRQWAKKLIDIGCTAIIGCHSHCVQGGEKYKDGYIVYGLGNFFLPWNTFANGSLVFPDFSKIEMVFDLDVTTNKAICHWFEYREEDHKLVHLSSEPFESSSTLQSYSPFQEMSDEDYLIYFKKHRRKKLLIPIYKDYRSTKINWFNTRLLKFRARFARTLAKYKILKWQS